MNAKAMILSCLCFLGANLVGCQALNGFSGGALQIANLPDSSSSRIQFLVNNGMFVATPNASRTKGLSEDYGLVATVYTNRLLSDEENKLIGDNDLDMPEPQASMIRKLFRYESKPLDAFNKVERYVHPNQPIQFNYQGDSGNKYCNVYGSFVPQSDTDYRIIGLMSYDKCYMTIEKIYFDAQGNQATEIISYD